jgi:ubiquitin-protein ligase E3 C
MNSFSFEGNYKAKRNINLGGVRAQEDKKRLLEKAQRERKAREAERLRNRNVTRIQVSESDRIDKEPADDEN